MNFCSIIDLIADGGDTMDMWNPWHGCHKCSPGCKNCYVFYLDSLRDKDANVVARSKTNFNMPLKRDSKSRGL